MMEIHLPKIRSKITMETAKFKQHLGLNEWWILSRNGGRINRNGNLR